ncbi:MAG: S-layer homology domain-containing protein [Clostridia bacterium]|nr:S-layer homology domain-containing protein [Clostridia bacterium]
MMAERKFVSGYEDNTIRPNNNVNRAEATAMIYNIISKSF